jgi:hypothetical protein
MPTTRPRYQVTETPEIARALDLAAQRWPNETRSKLLVRLVQAGRNALTAEHTAQATHRLAAIDATSGKYPNMFSDDHLAELRGDWPE